MTTLAPEWSGLAERYEAASSEQEREAILAETAQHERAEKTRQAAVRKRREDPVTNEWLDAAHAQYMQAEAQCAGKLVRNGSVITDAWALWSGPEWLARKSATEELRKFWDDHPRIPTQTAWREHQGEDVPPDEEISQDREAAVNPLGAAGHIARDAGRAAERSARIAGMQQRTREIAQQKAGELHAQVAVRGSAAFVKQRVAVDGAETLEYARRFLAHLVVWPSPEALTLATLWAAHTHCRDANGMLVFLSSPRLLFSSAEPGSGKSEAMKAVSRLCPSPVLMTEPSEPAVAHSIGAHDSIFLDECDVLFGKGTRKAAIRAIINDGYTPDGVWARVRNGQVHRLCTFGALALAGLDKIENGTDGQMAATLSRAWRLRMRRAPENWRAPRFDTQARYAAQLISERLGMWAAQNLDAIATHVPEMPEGVGNRWAQLAEPLLIVADMAGGDWPELGREAIEEMIATGGQPADDEEKTARLEDIMSGWTVQDAPVAGEISEEE